MQEPILEHSQACMCIYILLLYIVTYIFQMQSMDIAMHHLLGVFGDRIHEVEALLLNTVLCIFHSQLLCCININLCW